MGSRGRSIRLRIYFLVAIPLIAMVGLLAYVASTTVNNAVNLDRAPNLINATSLPTAEFINLLQSERAAAVIYLFQPTPDNLAAYDNAGPGDQAYQPKFARGDELAGHQEQPGRRRSAGHQGHHRRAEPAPADPGRRDEQGHHPAAGARRVQRGHPERAQAVPGRSEQPDQRRRGRPGPRADRDGVRQGGAVPGIRAAVRDAGRAAG